MSDKTIFTLLLFLTFTQVFSLYKIFHYRRSLEEKNFRTIQLYLDLEFIHNKILDNLLISDSAEFCRVFIDSIKEYYNLEDVIIIDSVRMNQGKTSTLLHSEIVNYAKNNIALIESTLQKNSFFRTNLYRKNINNLVLYITSLAIDAGNDGLIICIEKSPSLLTDQEMKSLKNTLNLLKSRLLNA